MPFQIQDTLPFSHKQAVEMLVAAPWTQQERDYIIQGGLVALHGSFGRELRNHWHLWEPTSPLSRHYQKTYGIGHADDISSLIIEDLVCHLRGEKYDIDSRVRRFRNYWLAQKVDPATQKVIQ